MGRNAVEITGTEADDTLIGTGRSDLMSGLGGNDCVNYIGYSYWNNINNHAGSDEMLIFVGLIFRQVDGALHNLWWLTVVGVLTTIVSIYSWAFEPTNAPASMWVWAVA